MPRKLVLNLGFTLLFWSIFDGLLSYFIPIYIIELGFTKTELGLIFAFQSITGAGFDFLISHYFKKQHYLFFFILFFILSAIFPLILLLSKTTIPLLFSMTIWGLYYNLLSFAIFDFSSVHSRDDEHVKNIGSLNIFRSSGYLLSTLISGIVVINSVISINNFLFTYVFLGISSLFFLFFF